MRRRAIIAPPMFVTFEEATNAWINTETPLERTFVYDLKSQVLNSAWCVFEEELTLENWDFSELKLPAIGEFTYDIELIALLEKVMVEIYSVLLELISQESKHDWIPANVVQGIEFGYNGFVIEYDVSLAPAPRSGNFQIVVNPNRYKNGPGNRSRSPYRRPRFV